jgi:hypothetical protein
MAPFSKHNTQKIRHLFVPFLATVAPKIFFIGTDHFAGLMDKDRPSDMKTKLFFLIENDVRLEDSVEFDRLYL